MYCGILLYTGVYLICTFVFWTFIHPHIGTGFGHINVIVDIIIITTLSLNNNIYESGTTEGRLSNLYGLLSPYNLQGNIFESR